MGIMIVFFIPLILFAASTYLIKKLIPFLKKKSLVDYPSERSNHKILVPKGAGIVLVPLFIFSLWGVFVSQDFFDKQWSIFLTSIVILFIVSLIDDFKNLSAPIRLLVHFITVAMSIFILKEDIYKFIDNNILSFIDFNPLFIFYLFSVALIILWIWIINLFNFMDGMDGLTCTQVLVLALTINILYLLGYMNENFQFLSLILISLFLAFYKFNKPTAQIFLGDVGSIPVGYIAGLVLIYNFLKGGPSVSILIVYLYYLFDSTLTLVIRLIKRKNIFEAHSDHFYQKILRAGQTHRQVLNKITFLLFFLFVFSMISIKYPISSLISAITFTVGFLFFLQRHYKNE